MRTTGPAQPAHLLLDVVDLLNELGVPYAVVGAFAVSFHGTPRYTDDADAAVWLKETGKTAAELQSDLAAARYQTELKIGNIGDPVAGVLVIKDEFNNRLDLILGIRGMDRAAIDRRRTTAFLGSSLQVIAAEDLIAMKIFAGGPQDLEDARGILLVSKETLNLDLLRRVTRRYGKQAFAKLAALLHELPTELD